MYEDESKSICWDCDTVSTDNTLEVKFKSFSISGTQAAEKGGQTDITITVGNQPTKVTFWEKAGNNKENPTNAQMYIGRISYSAENVAYSAEGEMVVAILPRGWVEEGAIWYELFFPWTKGPSSTGQVWSNSMYPLAETKKGATTVSHIPKVTEKGFWHELGRPTFFAERDDKKVLLLHTFEERRCKGSDWH